MEDSVLVEVEGRAKKQKFRGNVRLECRLFNTKKVDARFLNLRSASNRVASNSSLKISTIINNSAPFILAKKISGQSGVRFGVTVSVREPDTL